MDDRCVLRMGLLGSVLGLGCPSDDAGGGETSDGATSDATMMTTTTASTAPPTSSSATASTTMGTAPGTGTTGGSTTDGPATGDSTTSTGGSTGASSSSTGATVECCEPEDVPKCESGRTCCSNGWQCNDNPKESACPDEEIDVCGAGEYGPCPICGGDDVAFGPIGSDHCYCAPECEDDACPDPPKGDADAMCVITVEKGSPPTYCALVCFDNDDCPNGMDCYETTGGNFCTYPFP